MKLLRKLKRSTKTNQILNVLFIVLLLFLVIALFTLKGTITNFASKAMVSQAGSDIRLSESAFVDSAYNYTKNGAGYEFTFLEFGALNCSACRRMEEVMFEIKQMYPGKVNVVFVNVLLPEQQKLMKYYGIVAIPTQVLLNKDGVEYFRHTGYISASELSVRF